MSREAVEIAGEDVTLEGMLHLPEGPAGAWPGVVVCHPHPQYGGEMNNNVVMAVVDALVARGIAALRFNFRGVGRSGGTFDNGRGEARDAAAAVAFLAARDEVEAARVGLAGYSFGAMAALNAAGDDVRALALISPPLQWLNRERLSLLGMPLLMTTGDADGICPADGFEALVASLDGAVEALVVSGADHGWWGYERELDEIAGPFFARHLQGEGAT